MKNPLVRIKQSAIIFFILISIFISLITLERVFSSLSLGLSKHIQSETPIGPYLDLIGFKEHSCGGYMNYGGCSEGYYCHSSPTYLDAPGKCTKIEDVLMK